MTADPRFRRVDLADDIQSGMSMTALTNKYGLHNSVIQRFANERGLTISKHRAGRPKPEKPSVRYKHCADPLCDKTLPIASFYNPRDPYCRDCRKAHSSRAYDQRRIHDKRHGNRGISDAEYLRNERKTRLPLLAAAKAGDAQAQEELWQRFKCKVVG